MVSGLVGSFGFRRSIIRTNPHILWKELLDIKIGILQLSQRVK